MKQHYSDRYFRIALTNDDKQKKTVSIHRLVAMAYVDNPLNKPQVNHIDGNKHNNHYTNLEWCTQEENQLHADLTGLNKVKGIDNGTYKVWYTIKDGIKTIHDKETIRDFCIRNNLSLYETSYFRFKA